MSVSHSAHYEPTHSDVWTVLEELPHRLEALLKRHESSRELGFEALDQELCMRCSRTPSARRRARRWRARTWTCRMCSSTGRSIAGRTGARRPICVRSAR